MGSGVEGSGGAGAVRRRRSKPSGEATRGVQDQATVEQPTSVKQRSKHIGEGYCGGARWWADRINPITPLMPTFYTPASKSYRPQAGPITQAAS
jgi:hypothetical protein